MKVPLAAIASLTALLPSCGAPSGASEPGFRVSARLVLGADLHSLAVIAEHNTTVAELGELAGRKLVKKLRLGAGVVLDELESEGDWLDPEDHVGPLQLETVDGVVLGLLAEGAEGGDMIPAAEWRSLVDKDGHWLNDVAAKYGLRCAASDPSASTNVPADTAAPSEPAARPPAEAPDAGGGGDLSFFADEAMLILEQLRLEGPLESEDSAVEMMPSASPAEQINDWLATALGDEEPEPFIDVGADLDADLWDEDPPPPPPPPPQEEEEEPAPDDAAAGQADEKAGADTEPAAAAAAAADAEGEKRGKRRRKERQPPEPEEPAGGKDTAAADDTPPPQERVTASERLEQEAKKEKLKAEEGCDSYACRHSCPPAVRRTPARPSSLALCCTPRLRIKSDTVLGAGAPDG